MYENKRQKLAPTKVYYGRVQGKIFSSAYALFSGVAFITNIGFILAPAVHRLMHKIHIQES